MKIVIHKIEKSRLKEEYNKDCENLSRRPFMQVVYWVGFMFVIATLASCTERPIYAKKVKFDSVWTFADSVLFDMPAQDTVLDYRLAIGVEHEDNYPFQNIYLKIATTYPSGQRTENLFNIDMADIAGYWYGDCSRSRCELIAPLRQVFSFSETGVYQIWIKQYTRTDSLTGVNSISLCLWEEGE